MSLYRDVLRGKRLDPASVGQLQADLLGALLQSAQAIDVSGLDLDGLQPPKGEELAKPPYPAVWLEMAGVDPRLRYALGERCGVLVRTVSAAQIGGAVDAGGAGDLIDRDRLAGGIATDLFIVHRGVNIYLGCALVPQDREGNLFKVQDRERIDQMKAILPAGSNMGPEATCVMAVPRPGIERDKEMWGLVSRALIIGAKLATTTFALLNCRNVGLETRDQQAGKRGGSRRPAKKGTDWKVLTIRPAGGGARQPREGTSEQRMTRAHLVRGHFATYTEEAPLFGKYSGRFWWMPHVRGDKQAGSVIKDYRVAP